MNGQIVLCKGINDGEELERSIRDLAGYIPYMESVSVVPVGLTKYRDNLYPLQPFTKEDAREVLAIIHKWQKICYEKHGTHFIHAGDEWYLLAEIDFPEEERYDGYIQLENGVGMMRLLYEEFQECLREEEERMEESHSSLKDVFKNRRKIWKGSEKEAAQAMGLRGREHKITIATGKLAAPMLSKLAAAFMALHPEIQIQVITVINQFFGERITVSGLLTGQDLALQLAGEDLGEKLLLPCNMLRSGERVFLDDVTVEELENALQVPVHIVKSDGQSLFEEFLDIS